MSNLNFKIFLLDNGNYAELDCEDLDFTTSFSVTDITDISQRMSNISKNIKLKATQNNNLILGNLFNLSRYTNRELSEALYYNFSPIKGVSCKIYENNTLIFTGTFRITEMDCDIMGNYTYTAIVTGNLKNFFAQIGDDLLTDIKGFDSTHTYDLPAIMSSWDYTTGQDFVYPSIDYGAGIVPDPTKFFLKNFRTGIYLKTYLEKMFTKYGYRIKGNFLDSEVFKRAYIPYAEQDFAVTQTGILFSADTSNYNYTFDDSYSGYLPVLNAVSNNYITVSADKKQFTYTRDVITQATLNVVFAASFTSTQDEFTNAVLNINNKQYILTNSGLTDTVTYTMPFSSYSGSTSFGVPFGLYFGRPNVPDGGQIPSNPDVYLDIVSASVTVGGTDIQNKVAVNLGDSISLNQVIPQDVKVVDFLKSVLQFFNLYLMDDPDNPYGFIVEPYDIFYNQANYPSLYAYDWTKKVDYTSGTKLTFSTDLPSAYNFKFKEDDDYYNDLYHTKYNDYYGNFSIDNNQGVADAKDVEVSFSPTIIVQENGDDKIMPSIFKGELTQKEPFKSNLRVLFNNGISTCENYEIVDVSGNTQSSISGLTSYNTSHHLLTSGNDILFNLLFGLPKEIYSPVPNGQGLFTLPTLYTGFYQNQLLELNDNNLYGFEVDVLLNEIDISNLDMRTPVYLMNRNGGAYFKVLSIDYSSSYEPASVKLQRIVN